MVPFWDHDPNRTGARFLHRMRQSEFALRLICGAVHNKHLNHNRHCYRNPETAILQQVATGQRIPKIMLVSRMRTYEETGGGWVRHDFRHENRAAI